MSFMERLKKEREELSDKIEKLMLFLVSEKFNELDDQNKLLLNQQEVHMQCYLRVLDQRIELLSGK
ncbi:hypothetical protein D3C77_28970 [compost metagenome]